MKLILALLLAIAVCSLAQVDEALLKTHFERFALQFNKVYNSQEEKARRFDIFKQSIDRINKKNAEHGEPIFGVTKFSDMTPEEFKGRYLTKLTGKREAVHSDVLTPKAGISVPETLDWSRYGYVTPVKNQKQCGSCWAFSATENIESQWIMAGKGTNTTVLLSPQQIVDCDKEDDGCNGGDLPTAFDYVIKAGGMMTESKYPYKGKDQKCMFSKNDVLARISTWKYATTNSDEVLLKSNLASYGPLAICVEADTWMDYTGGIIKKGCGRDLDHCVELTGYGKKNSDEYWIVRNSWDTDWGIAGYIYIQIGKDLCGIADEAATVVI